MAASLFKWFFAGICLLSGGRAAHPFYVSVTEIDHKAKDKTLEVSCKLFTNDFEAALEKWAHGKVDLTHPKDRPAMDKMIGDYVLAHLRIRVDGHAVPLHMIGSEQEAEATWSYFEADGIPSVKRIDLSNSLLYDTFDQQINIMHVTVAGTRKSTRLNRPDTEAYLEF
ncbi:MAG: hypothetical protein Q8927_13740 [Bacteroidota bacterium]|nr:hypothetical protein [Bacteroidota bacterium]MDP4217260.1 hypothetical protein [Bacteroidota bacterium]MDP4244900.1 hypothetical protein [Bacteroidota bacterium]MDP4255449.1 hypothetical protein [Bacteroidota bacterium]MDP4257128.1 hypothetical protein [Bacteroidota bacterium]